METVFVRVARLADLTEHRGMRVVVCENEIALWYVQGRVFAVGDVCAHQHVPTIHEGVLSGLTVTCPRHGWTYSLESGKAVEGDGCLPVYPVKVEKGEVFVAVPAEKV